MKSREISTGCCDPWTNAGHRHLLQALPSPRPPPEQQQQQPQHQQRLDTDVVIVLGVVLCVLITAVWVHSVVRCVARRNERLRRPTRVVGVAEGNNAAGGSGTLSADRGLDAKTIDLLPIVTASSSEMEAGRLSMSAATAGFEQMPPPMVVPATECAVCLQEFDPGEPVKLLPNCGHSFHVQCIAGWLRIHGSCPVCRHGVLDPPSPRWSTSSSAVDVEAVPNVTPGGSSGFYILSSPIMQRFQQDFQLMAGGPDAAAAAAAAAELVQSSPSSLYSMFAADGARTASFVHFLSTRPPGL